MNSKIYTETVIISSHWKENLSDDDVAMLDFVFRGFTRRHETKNHITAERDISVVKSFIVYVGQAPWFCNEDDFIDWCLYLRNVRKVKPQTLITYQGIVRRFTEFYAENDVIYKKLRDKYGILPRPVCDRTLCIPNPHRPDTLSNKPALSNEEFDGIFVKIDEAIDIAVANNLKGLYPLLRDKVLYYTAYALSLRACEVISLKITSFHPDISQPQYGKFGMAFVEGKGHSGSGTKTRAVPIKNFYFPVMIEHYIKTIRPMFLKYADTEEKSLFLSERGKPLSYRAYHDNFRKLLEMSGLGGMGYSTHTLRRTGLSHAALWMNVCTIQEIAGHADPGTTGRYISIPKEHTRKQLNNIYQKQIDTINKRGE